MHAKVWPSTCQRLPIPNLSHMFSVLFQNWQETGSVLNKKRHYAKRALTEEKLEDMRARIEVSLRKSSRGLAEECSMSKRSVLRGLKMLKFFPYKVSVAHRLNDTDPAVHVNFCRWMLQSVHDGDADPSL
ncbi:MAG: hypothetical protein FWF27_06540, partial [Candidatus Bathyarchaeota archaeon]|nr:hypothetical protein [Candidatus Termiticorpusculum sp.]